MRAWRAQRTGGGTGGALALPRDHACTRPPGALRRWYASNAGTEVDCAQSAVGGRRTLRGLAQSVRRCTSTTCALRSDHDHSPPVPESWRWVGIPRQPARRRRVPRETWRRSGPLPSWPPSRTAPGRRPGGRDSGGADVWVVGAERVAARRSVGSCGRRAARVRARPVPRETTARRRAPGCSLRRRMCAQRPVLLGTTLPHAPGRPWLMSLRWTPPPVATRLAPSRFHVKRAPGATAAAASFHVKHPSRPQPTVPRETDCDGHRASRSLAGSTSRSRCANLVSRSPRPAAVSDRHRAPHPRAAAARRERP